MPTRRQVLVGATALGGAALLGGGALLTVRDNYGGWIREVLQKHLPRHVFDEEGLALYVREYTTKKDGENAYKLEIYALAEGVADPSGLLPSGLAEKIAAEERRIVTGFLMRSDFFAGAAHPRKITYFGAGSPCGNPFATF